MNDELRFEIIELKKCNDVLLGFFGEILSVYAGDCQIEGYLINQTIIIIDKYRKIIDKMNG